MDGFNRVILLGNVGSEPELKKTTHGTSILSLRIATSESYVERETKSRKERTEWHKVVVFGQAAENLSKFLGKGDKLLIEGKLRTRSYEAKAGHKVYTTEVVSDKVILRGKAGGGSGGGKGSGGKRSEQRQEEPEQDPFGGADVDDDDVPF